MKKYKEPWQVAAARYCVENSEKGFIFSDLVKYIKSKYTDVSEPHIHQFIEEEIQAPSGRRFSRDNRGGSWIAPLDLVSKITDYDELKEARKSSKYAMAIAIGSLLIATLVGTAQILVQVYLN